MTTVLLAINLTCVVVCMINALRKNNNTFAICAVLWGICCSILAATLL